MNQQHTGAISNASPLAVHAVTVALRRFPDLTPNGFGSKAAEAYADPWEGEEIEWAMRFLTPLEKTNRPTFSSYFLKHVAEQRLNFYISNGAFIVACVAADFVVEPYGRGNPNAGIGIARHDIDELRRART